MENGGDFGRRQKVACTAKTNELIHYPRPPGKKPIDGTNDFTFDRKKRPRRDVKHGGQRCIVFNPFVSQ